jgi:transcriptional regulator with XRE-family HTH domain
MGRVSNPVDARRIRRARIERGLTQAELAALGGWPEVTVKRWESSFQSPEMKNLRALAGLLGVRIVDLLVDDEVA